MKKLSALASLMMLATVGANAADYTIEVQNLTRSTLFTPLLVAAHSTDSDLFSVGEPATLALQTMAEGGNITPLAAEISDAGGMIVENPAGGLLVAGATTTAMFNNDAAPTNDHLSIVAMLLPTNDGFVGLDSMLLPTEPGTYRYMLKGYDAGTEANNELRGSGAPGEAGMPVPPPLDPLLGTNGTGMPGDAEGFVHIHRGVLGDTDSVAGASDIDATRHRWLNPVARVTITVK
ncbi:spondin domain-containing protein [Gilvimarinus polysaccharolyticus]|uniref:spondin domain-containing protein n=1 Tax=Gilvimarinus polysaccharolyticus TaxID=863921 RepID=UPI0006738D3F|nr:spondin domain-containing protein [Gilvimarinus polysaccharolyticus]